MTTYSAPSTSLCSTNVLRIYANKQPIGRVRICGLKFRRNNPKYVKCQTKSTGSLYVLGSVEITNRNT